MLYIGQTNKSARVRLNKHLYAIKKFVPYLHIKNEVGLHFNLPYHNFKDHFRFFIFKENVKLLVDRLSIEKDLINLFMYFNPPLINSRKPSTFDLKNLALSLIWLILYFFTFCLLFTFLLFYFYLIFHLFIPSSLIVYIQYFNTGIMRKKNKN
jgi:hypothetical protein